MAIYNIEDMKLLARDQNGKCLSKDYINFHSDLAWMCARGHTFDATPAQVKRGAWCKQCEHYVRRRITIEDLQEMAFNKGGKCISKKYIDQKTPLEWECEFGHRWFAKCAHMRSVGSWCPHCSGRAKMTIEQMQELAKKKGGVCLSKKYVNSHSKLKWQCDKGHKWMAEASHILAGRWCPHYDCRYRKVSEKLRGNIDELKEIAKERGGKLLSKEYTNRNIPLVWQCANKHQWEAKASNVKFGLTWCPFCDRSLISKTAYKKAMLARTKK